MTVIKLALSCLLLSRHRSLLLQSTAKASTGSGP